MGLRIDDFENIKPSLGITPTVVETAFDKEDIKNVFDILKDVPTKELDIEGAKFKISYIPYVDETAWVYGKMYDLAIAVNDEAYFFQDLDMVELILYMEFNEGDFVNMHLDLGNEPPHAGRKLTSVINLNDSDNYRGGQVNVLSSQLTPLSRTTGDCTFFPSYLQNEITPIESGTKKLLITWFGGSNFK